VEKESYKFEPHNPKKIKSISWQVCSKCGLVYLNNSLTRWAIDKGCNNDDHPGRANAIKRYGGIK